MRLYDYWRSSAAYRVRIGLGLVGLPWESVPVDLTTGAQSDPAYLAKNPQGLVPALEIDGLLLPQSLAILEYLDETRGGLMPRDPAGRARVRAMAYAVAMDIHPICNLRVGKEAERISEGRTSWRDWCQTFIPLGFKGLEEMLAAPESATFCHGETPGLADCCLVPQVYNAHRWGVDMTPFPRIAAVAERCAALPAFAQAHPDACKP